MKQLIKSCAATLANQFGPHRLGGSRHAPRLWVLMYHRILPAQDLRYPLEEPGMIVEPETFAMHLRELKKHFDVMDFDEWLALRAQHQPLPKRACVITFDDGWYDNYEFALPLIQQEKVPVTLFAVVDKIATDFQFWPNLVSALLASNALTTLKKHPLFASALTDIPTHAIINRELMARVIHSLKQFSDADIFNALDEIRWKSLLNFELPRGLMNWDELRAMQNSGLVKIGSHTANHKRLNKNLSGEELHQEIVASHQRLKEILPEAVDIFCFPNGDYNQAALNLVENTYSAAVTTARGIVSGTTTPIHQLCRIGLHQHVSNSPRLLGARLSGWL